MRFVLITFLTFLSCVSFFAQDKKESPVIDFSTLQDNTDPDCRESNNFGFREGKVIKIISGNSFLFAVDDEIEKETYKVVLAAIDAGSNSSLLKKLLIENILNQKVLVIGDNSGSRKILGAVYSTEPNKIGSPNRYFLKNGLAKYIEPKRRLVPNYILCEYRKFAKQAKEAGLGIWAK